MIEIQKSETADIRTCDFANVSEDQLLASSRQHIKDVARAMAFFSTYLFEAAAEHDYDKLTEIDWFHADFKTGFRETSWWDNHRKIHRHHLAQKDGVPEDVNLLDVLEYIADCVMAGMARSGEVYPLDVIPGMLLTAFNNTVDLLKNNTVLNIVISPGEKPPLGGMGGSIHDWERGTSPWHEDSFPDLFDKKAAWPPLETGAKVEGWYALDFVGNQIGFLADGTTYRIKG